MLYCLHFLDLIFFHLTENLAPHSMARRKSSCFQNNFITLIFRISREVKIKNFFKSLVSSFMSQLQLFRKYQKNLLKLNIIYSQELHLQVGVVCFNSPKIKTRIFCLSNVRSRALIFYKPK